MERDADRVRARIKEIYRDEKERHDSDVTEVFSGTLMAVLELMKTAPPNPPPIFTEFTKTARECLEAVERETISRARAPRPSN